MEPTAADLEKFVHHLDRMSLSKFFDVMTGSMARFVRKHAADREDVNGLRAELVELRRRVAELESRNG